MTTSGHSEPDRYTSYVVVMYVQHQQLYVVLLHTLDQVAAGKVDIYTCVHFGDKM